MPMSMSWQWAKLFPSLGLLVTKIVRCHYFQQLCYRPIYFLLLDIFHGTVIADNGVEFGLQVSKFICIALCACTR